jgi:hypothetical protein
MLSITVSGISGLTARLDQALATKLKQVAKDVQAVAKSYTPVRTGRARGSWTETTSKSNFSVENSTPYIGYLDKGTRRMKPANNGKGIIMPTINQIKGKY